MFPGSEGKHVLSAATDSGDYWEQAVEITAISTPSVAVSFAKVRADKAALEKTVTTLREHVGTQEKELADSKGTNESGLQSFFQPAVLSSRRHSIVEAINVYTDRFGKEMGMRDSRDESSQNINDAVAQQSLSNLGNPDPNAQAVGNLVMLGELIAADRIKKKAIKNSIAGASASARMEYLGKALEDPVKYPPDKADADYLTIVRKVERNKVSGELTTSPDHIGYTDQLSSIQISCSSLRGASTSKSKSGLQIHIKYWDQGSGTAKPQAKTLVVQGLDKSDGEDLLGEVYLACPKLTQ